MTIIQRDVALRLGLKPSDQEIPRKLAERKYFDTGKFVFDVPIQVGEYGFQTTMLMADIADDLLLGGNFLHRYDQIWMLY